MTIVETASSYDNLGECAARIGKKLTQSVSEYTCKAARRVAILVLGSSILAVGIVMVVTPGPAIVVIPIGLAILGAEFAWARVWLKKVREGISSQSAKYRGSRVDRHRKH